MPRSSVSLAVALGLLAPWWGCAGEAPPDSDESLPVVVIAGPTVIAFYRIPESDSVLVADPAFATALDDMQYYGVESRTRLAELGVTYLSQPGRRFLVRDEHRDRLFTAEPDSSDVGYLLVPSSGEYSAVYRVQYPEALTAEVQSYLATVHLEAE